MSAPGYFFPTRAAIQYSPNTDIWARKGDSENIPPGTAAGEFLSWNGTSWVPGGATEIIIGANASGSVEADTIAIGRAAGGTPTGSGTIAIGVGAGGSSGQSAIAIGSGAGDVSQGSGAVAIGSAAAQLGQGPNAISIGSSSSASGFQSEGAVAIGAGAQNNSAGLSAIAIGTNAGNPLVGTTGQDANSIVINATGVNTPSAGAGTLVVKPIRGAPAPNALLYDSATGEITYGAVGVSSPGGVFLWVQGVLGSNTKEFYRSRSGFEDAELVFTDSTSAVPNDAAWNGSYWLFSAPAGGNTSIFYKTASGAPGSFQISASVPFSVRGIVWNPPTGQWFAVSATNNASPPFSPLPGAVYVSSDGLNWTLIGPNPTTANVVANFIGRATNTVGQITTQLVGGYHDTLFSPVSLFSNTNGSTWNIGWNPGTGDYSGTNFSTAPRVNDIIFTNAQGTGCMFVGISTSAVGSGPATARSVVNFTAHTSTGIVPNTTSPTLAQYNVRQAAWNGQIIVMIGDNNDNITPLFWYSTDNGFNWQPCSGLAPLDPFYTSIIWNGGNFFAISRSSHAISFDGINWIETPNTPVGQSIAGASQMVQPFTSLYNL
jgi:hypothetical protein